MLVRLLDLLRLSDIVVVVVAAVVVLLLLWLYMPFGLLPCPLLPLPPTLFFYDPQQLQRLLLYIYANDLVDRSSSEVAAVPLAGP